MTLPKSARSKSVAANAPISCPSRWPGIRASGKHRRATKAKVTAGLMWAPEIPLSLQIHRGYERCRGYVPGEVADSSVARKLNDVCYGSDELPQERSDKLRTGALRLRRFLHERFMPVMPHKLPGKRKHLAARMRQLHLANSHDEFRIARGAHPVLAVATWCATHYRGRIPRGDIRGAQPELVSFCSPCSAGPRHPGKERQSAWRTHGTAACGA